MGGDSSELRRHSIRLRGYDYSQTGAYFVTICSHERENYFGRVVDGEMQLSAMGTAAERYWREIPHHFPHTALVTPVGAQHAAPLPPPHRMPISNGVGRANVAPRSLGAIVRSFKSAVSREINATRRKAHSPVWQRNYYEHIIRNEKELDGIRHYIEDNPTLWPYDRENSNAPHLAKAVGRALAGHYGFTDEELDFIINYDIKYRMARDTDEAAE